MIEKELSIINKVMFVLIASLIFSFISFSTANASVVSLTKTIQPDSVQGSDADIRQQNPTSNYSTATNSTIGRSSGYYARSCLKFDLGSIPPNATITNADLKLYYYSGTTTTAPMDISVHEIINSWIENSVSWNKRDSATNWTTAGGDYDSQEIATFTGITSTYGWYTWNITSLAQGWYNGAIANNGLLLRSPSESGTTNISRKFYTSDYSTNITQRPQLVITYTIDDTTGPDVRIDAPLNNAVVRGQAQVTVDASDTVSGINRVEIYVDSNLVTTIAAEPYEYTWDTGGLTDGNHTIQAKAYDTAGNEGISENVSVTVNNAGSVMTTTIQPDAAAGKDSGLSKYSPNNNYCNNIGIEVGGDITGTTHGVFQFDLSSIPAGATITNARLKLYKYNSNGSNVPINIGAHRITSTWDEAAVSWNNRQTGTAWAVAGGDYRSLAESTSNMSGDAQWESWDITALTQSWYNGAVSNNGILLKGYMEGTYNDYFRKFYSSDYAVDIFKRPILEVTYMVADTTGPDVRIDAPLNNAVVRGQAQVTVDASDTVSGINRVEIYVDSNLVTTIAAEPYEYTWDTGGLTDGNHTIQAKAYDTAGNEGISENVSVTVNNAGSVMTTTIQPDAAAGKDSYILKSNPNTNNGTKQSISVGGDIGHIQHGLVQFDLSSIPAGATITSAKMKLYVYGANGTPLDISIHRVTAPWDEVTANWNNRQTGTAWSIVGGDYRSLAESTIKNIGTTAGWQSWDITALAQEWNLESVPNYGLLLRGNKESSYDNYSRTFYSSDYTTKPSFRPVLEVSYMYKPLDGAVVWGPTPIYIETSDNLSGVEKVEIYVDGVLKSTITEAPYQYIWDTTTVANGSHSVMVKVYDNAGNIGQPTANVTVDNSSTPVNPSNIHFKTE